jgi:hypothetical protein
MLILIDIDNEFVVFFKLDTEFAGSIISHSEGDGWHGLNFLGVGLFFQCYLIAVIIVALFYFL